MILDSELSHLELAELVRRSNKPITEDGVTYAFRHALIQDTARASLLLHERKRLNRLVGEALESLYLEDVDEYTVRMAQHFEEAGDDPKTYKYSLRAGENALRTNALAEALQHFTRALDAAQRADLDPTEPFLKRGRVLEVQDRFPEAMENYRAMQTYARQKNLPALEMGGMMACATLHSIPSVMYDSALAEELSEQALTLARGLGNRAAEAKILWNRLLQYSRADVRYRQAVQVGELALAIARAENLQEQTAYLLNDLSPTYAFLGDAKRAEAYNLEARAMWRTLNNLPMVTDNLGYAAMNRMFTADYRGAIDSAEQALKISREINNIWGETFAQTWSGEAYWATGDIGTALQVMENAVALAAHSFPAPLVLTRGDYARLLSDLGDTHRALEIAQQAVDKAQSTFPAMYSWAQGALAYVHIRRGEWDAAGELVQSVFFDPGADDLPLFQWERMRVHVEWQLARGDPQVARSICEQLLHRKTFREGWLYGTAFLILHARADIALGNAEAALATLNRAEALCRAQDGQWNLWQILALRAHVYTTLGQNDAADTDRTAARAVIETIAARTPEPLRPGFLKQAHQSYEF